MNFDRFSMTMEFDSFTFSEYKGKALYFTWFCLESVITFTVECEHG